MSELVSVILTTYNNPVGLLSSLGSALNQTHKNLEILVVDGGNNKWTKQVVDMLKDKRVTHIKVGNCGYSNRICGNVQFCRNIGVRLAQGRYVAMLDDDDVWMPTKIEEQVKLMAITCASLICCHTHKISGCATTIDKPLSNPTFNDLLQTFNFSQTSAYFMNKKDLTGCGGFDENVRSMHEYDVALRMAKCGLRIDVVHKPLLISCCDNATRRGYYFIKIAELLDLYRCYGKDMMKLKIKQIIFNFAKTTTLLSLYVLGYVVKEKVWKVIFKLKERFQNDS